MAGWTRASFRKVGQRKANAIAKVSFFGIAGIGEDGLRAVRMALGAVGPVVVRSPEAEEAFLSALPGHPAAGIADALDQLARRTRPIDDLRSTREYRRQVALRLAARFLEEVTRP
jgi:CO/xanthine dehydrogenase FAD-binding subunit